jgi:hypothetical protein
LQNIANRLWWPARGQAQERPQERQVADIEGFVEKGSVEGARGSIPTASAIGALQAARQARREAELAGCEMEELTAALHSKPPVGRWPRLARASFGPSVAVLSG